MRVRKARALCWQHGHAWHLIDGTEDGVLDLGLCARCMVEAIPDPVKRRRFVRAHFAEAQA